MMTLKSYLNSKFYTLKQIRWRVPDVGDCMDQSQLQAKVIEGYEEAEEEEACRNLENTRDC